MIKPTDPFSIPSLENDVSAVRWLTIVTMGGGFVILYAALIGIVKNGWNTIREQRAQLENRVREVTALNEMFQKNLKERDDALAMFTELQSNTEESLFLLRGLANARGVVAAQERR